MARAAGHCGGLAAPGTPPASALRLRNFGIVCLLARLVERKSRSRILRLALNAPAACDPPQCRPRSIVDPTATLRTRPWLPWGSVRPRRRRRGWRHCRRGSYCRRRLRGSQSSDEFIKGWIEVRTREDVPSRCEVQPIRNQATTQRIQENTKQSFPITHTVLYCLRRTGSIGEPWISLWAGMERGRALVWVACVGILSASRKIVARSCAQLSRVRSHTIPSLRIPVATHEAVPAQRAHTSVRPRGPHYQARDERRWVSRRSRGRLLRRLPRLSLRGCRTRGCEGSTPRKRDWAGRGRAVPP